MIPTVFFETTQETKVVTKPLSLHIEIVTYAGVRRTYGYDCEYEYASSIVDLGLHLFQATQWHVSTML